MIVCLLVQRVPARKPSKGQEANSRTRLCARIERLRLRLQVHTTCLPAPLQSCNAPHVTVDLASLGHEFVPETSSWLYILARHSRQIEENG